MSTETGKPAHLVVDHELLWRLDQSNSPEEWERSLRRTGLWSLSPAEGEHGREVSELVRTVAEWARQEARPQAAHTAMATAVGATVVLAGWLALSVTLPSPLNLLAGLAWAAACAWWYSPSRGERPAQERQDALARRAQRLLRALLGRTFIGVHGDVVVENLPHREYLALRIRELDDTIAACDARLDEMARTREGIRAANARLGRDAEDAETAGLEAAMETEQQLRARLLGASADLRRRLVDFEGELDRLRLVAERLALSERASRLTDGSAADDSLRLAADVEVDVAGIEAELSGLLGGAREADARALAVLEVVGAGRGARRGGAARSVAS